MSAEESAPTRAPITNYGTISTSADAGKRHQPDVILGMVAQAQAASWRAELERVLVQAVAAGEGVLVIRGEDGWTAEASGIVPPATIVAMDPEATGQQLRAALQDEAAARAQHLANTLKRPQGPGFGDIFGNLPSGGAHQ